jgi:hypothetical protein
MPQALIDAHEFFRGAVAEFPFWKEDLRPRLEAALSDYIGAQARFDLRPEVQAVQDWLTQQLAISFAADAGAASTPLDRMGDGWQSLIRLAALDVLSQYPGEIAEKVVLLFEEPETHLHPSSPQATRRPRPTGRSGLDCPLRHALTGTGELCRTPGHRPPVEKRRRGT